MTATGRQTSAATSHPPAARLAEFGLGKLDDDEAATIAGHLSGCDPCRLLVAAVADDSLADLFRKADGRRSGGDRGGPAPDESSASGYERLEIIGEGGMGVVYKARQLGLGRVVALKQVHSAALAGHDGAARFRREAEAAARLRHPNIVPIYDVGWLDGVPFYAMEFVEGGTLAGRIATGPIRPDEAARLIEALARAVQHAHESGIVHRDLKPANILLSPDLGSPKISDFGLAKWTDDEGSRTRTGTILGTPNYMAPEQAEGDSARVGPGADVYALGAILYEMLTGRPPFTAPSVLETLEMVRRDEPAAPRHVRRDLPRDLETIALKCLEKSAERRYATARALADDLRRHLDREPILARPISPPERLAKWARRRPWRAVSAALGVLAAGGLVAGMIVHNARLRAEVTRTEQKAEEAREQRERADTQYRAVRDAIARMAHRVDESKFAGLQIPAEFRRQILEDALAFYEGAVRDDNPAAFAEQIDKLRALGEVATFQSVLARPDDTERTLRRSLALIERLAAESPDHPDVLGARVESLSKLGLAISADAKRIEESVAYLRRAIETAERLALDDPSSFVRGDALAWCHHNLGSVFQYGSRLEEAEGHHLRAAAIREALLKSHPEQHGLQARLAETLINLGLVHSNIAHAARADAEYTRAVELLAPVVRDHSGLQAQGLSLAKLYLNWGGLALVEHRPDRAIERYTLGLGALDRLDRTIPGWPDARHVRRNLNGAMAQAHEQAARFADAAHRWSLAIDLTDGDERLNFRLARACDLAKAGEDDAALAEAEAIESAGKPDGADLYNLACVASLASAHAGASARADACAARALDWLGRARDLGLFRDPEMLTSLDHDADLDALRQRRDFRLFRLDAAFPVDPFTRAR